MKAIIIEQKNIIGQVRRYAMLPRTFWNDSISEILSVKDRFALIRDEVISDISTRLKGDYRLIKYVDTDSAEWNDFFTNLMSSSGELVRIDTLNIVDPLIMNIVVNTMANAINDMGCVGRKKESNDTHAAKVRDLFFQHIWREKSNELGKQN